MPAREPAPSVAAAEAPPSFESAMDRLETLVEQMENALLPLEELIRSYEEGIRLVRVCNERLSAAEQRIEIITRDAAGQAQVSEMSPPAAAKSPSTAKEPPAVSRPSKNPNEVSLF